MIPGTVQLSQAGLRCHGCNGVLPRALLIILPWLTLLLIASPLCSPSCFIFPFEIIVHFLLVLPVAQEESTELLKQRVLPKHEVSAEQGLVATRDS